MASVKLQWSNAEVEDAALTVPLEGKHTKGWKQSFEQTVKLLGDGMEEKLRHHLESVVAQANAAHKAPDDPGADDEDSP